jgi:hypothetical protein
VKSDPQWWTYVLPPVAALLGVALGQVIALAREKATRDHAVALAARAEGVTERTHHREVLDEAAVVLNAVVQAVNTLEFTTRHWIDLGRRDEAGEVPDDHREAFTTAMTKVREDCRACADEVNATIRELRGMQARLDIRFERDEGVLVAFANARRRILVWALMVGRGSDEIRRERDVAKASASLDLAELRSKSVVRRRERFNDAARKHLTRTRPAST